MVLLPGREGMDYRRARLRAFFSGILAAISGEPRQLLAFDEVREKLHLGGPVYRGVKTVPLTGIATSTGRSCPPSRIPKTAGAG